MVARKGLSTVRICARLGIALLVSGDQMTAFGASCPLALAQAKVSSPNGQMVYRGGCGSGFDDECASPSATMSGSRSARPRASRKER
jgi:hypothetical protein